MRRRHFIKAGTVLATGLTLPWARGAHSEVRGNVRKSLIHLPLDDLDLVRYRRAVAIMKSLDGSKDPRRWAAHADTHVANAPHLNWWFLPWHRAFLHYFEETCRDVLQEPLFKLPYWDWTRYPYIPSPFLDPRSPLWQAGRNIEGAVQIDFGSVAASVIDEILQDVIMNDVFGRPAQNQSDAPGPGELEGRPHSAVHQSIGGTMSFSNSPLDPLFWVHHCNVDRIWESWLTLHGRPVPADSVWANHPLDKFCDPLTKRQASPPCVQTVNARLFGAQYDQLETFFGYVSPAKLPSLQIFFGPGDEIRAPGAIPIILAPSESAKIDGQRVTFSIDVTPEFRQLLDSNVNFRPLDSRPLFPSFVLLLDRAPFPKKPTTSVRVFLNTREAGSSTPFDDAGYVATVSFFPTPGPRTEHMDHTETSFSFNVASNIAKLKAAGRQSNRLEVALVSMDLLNPNAVPEPVRPTKVRIVGFRES